MPTWTRSLRLRLVAVGVLAQVLLLVLLVGNSQRLIETKLVDQTRARIAAIEHAYVTAVAMPMVARDYASLRDIIDGWREAREVAYIVVMDTGGRVLAASGHAAETPLPAPSTHFDPAELHHVRFPVRTMGQTFGTVQYGLSLEHLAAARQALLVQSALLAAFAIAASLLLLGFAGYLLTRRLVALTEASSHVAAGEYDVRLPADGDDEVARLARNFNDMAHAVEARVDELRFQARHDSLTGLHNRRAFEMHMADALARRREHALFMLYIDLDQFKAVNDSCGHVAGDLLLQRVTTFLMQQRTFGFVARLGGDEFALVIEGGDEAAALDHARRIIDGIRGIDFSWEGQSFSIGASVGIVRAEADLDNVTNLLMAADSACYAAKEHGRNRAEIYRRGDDWYRQRQSEFDILPRITEALAEGRFELFHQRIESLGAAGAPAAEVLVRMRETDGTLVLPGEFIPAAERYNLMPFLDRWVIEATMRQFAAWRAAGRAPPFHHLSVNLSGPTLNDADLPRFLEEKLAAHGVDPHHLCFEITESAAVADPERALEFIRRVRALGAAVSLDDFGSGLSSFGYLKQFRVDYLKIDGQFVRNLDRDPTDRAVVEAMVRLARAHGLRSVAEYVVSPQVLEVTRVLGVDYAQGYALHEPAPLAAA